MERCGVDIEQQFVVSSARLTSMHKSTPCRGKAAGQFWHSTKKLVVRKTPCPERNIEDETDKGDDPKDSSGIRIPESLLKHCVLRISSGILDSF